MADFKAGDEGRKYHQYQYTDISSQRIEIATNAVTAIECWLY